MNEEDRIKEIMEDIKQRTSSGVILDVIELVEIRENARRTVRLTDIALGDIKKFADKYMPDPTNPLEDNDVDEEAEDESD
jgi:hypothetical protein